MSELVALVTRIVAELLMLGITHPPLGFAAAGGWMFAISAARRFGVKPGFGGRALVPLVLLTWLWKNRRDLRESIFCFGLTAGVAVVFWAVLLLPSGRARVVWLVGYAGVAAGALWAFFYLDGRAPTWRNFRAARAQSLREWDAQRTVAAVTDPGVQVTQVRADGDAVTAVVTVAPGQSPTDLEGQLMDRLGGTVHRLTGREAVSVSVSKTGTPGVFRVRVDTGHPLREVVLWRDLPRR